ncbi:MAG TPA: hypothetical protein VGE06_11005 [Flavisolibacter sp.]
MLRKTSKGGKSKILENKKPVIRRRRKRLIAEAPIMDRPIKALSIYAWFIGLILVQDGHEKSRNQSERAELFGTAIEIEENQHELFLKNRQKRLLPHGNA